MEVLEARFVQLLAAHALVAIAFVACGSDGGDESATGGRPNVQGGSQSAEGGRSGGSGGTTGADSGGSDAGGTSGADAGGTSGADAGGTSGADAGGTDVGGNGGDAGNEGGTDAEAGGSSGMDGSGGDPCAPESAGAQGEPIGECNAVTASHPSEGGTHVSQDAELAYCTNPPSSGAHYSSWADFRSYTEPVPRGNWVHSLEHGAVVVLYSCDDCEDEIADATAWIDALPQDPLCVAQDRARRVILTPDPLLDVRWAAAAWTFTLRADCFDPTVFQDFYDEHYGQGAEDLCIPGIDPTAE